MPGQQTVQTLQVALSANAAAYRRAIQTSAPGDCWDYLVLTAANEKQAQGYRQELALRERSVGPAGAFFPAIQKTLVVADPPGPRIGSGGATLGVMRALVERFRLDPARDFEHLRILLIHSGGMSQRLPAYSPLGKIFAPLPLLRPDGQICTLLDHLYITLCGLPPRLGPGMLVVAGDVFLLFDHRHVTAGQTGVTALSMRTDAELGQGHGVFVADPAGRIQRTLQKVGIDEMRAAGATDERGQVLIDTGLLFFDAARVRTMAQLGGAARGRGAIAPQTHVDLYDDVTAAMAGQSQAKSYLAAGNRDVRCKLWAALHGVPFGVMQLEGQFLHLGTTRQFRDAMVGDNPSPAAELFQQNVLAHTPVTIEPGRRVYHSVLLGDAPAQRPGQKTPPPLIGPRAVVEHSILAADSRIRAGSVVSQVLALGKPIRLDEDLLLFQVPVLQDGGRRAYAHVICGVEDDFKGSHADGRCLFLNRNVEQWFARHGIKPAEVWHGVEPVRRTLWNARLFPATPDRDAADAALWIGRDLPASNATLAGWRKSARYSMSELLEHADPQGLIEHREVVAAYLQTGAMLDSIRRDEDRPADAAIAHYATAEGYAAAVRAIREFAQPPAAEPFAALRQSRALWAASQLLLRPDHPHGASSRIEAEDLAQLAFAKIAEASELGSVTSGVGYRVSGVGSARPETRNPKIDTQTPGLHLSPKVCIEATSPVRIDLAGGWTDTPPYCFERGGHVVNVAIDLNGQPPVRAVVRTVAQPRLLLESHDLGQTLELKTLDVSSRADVRDAFALHKVALGMSGLLAPGPVAPQLRRLGAGLVVATECRVPKGSGLGTSSILAATLLGALHELAGRKPSSAELIEQTLLLEQRLSTGGGWQDQVGGIIGGVKSTVTSPGVPQRPMVEQTELSDGQIRGIEERLVVYYSGQQRLARDILRRVVGRWLGREPAMLAIESQLKQGAAALRGALVKGQWSGAARHIADYWRLKKDIYPGSTTPSIDVLFLELAEHYLAAGLAGAGGGGFAYFFCKDARCAARLRKALAERSSQPGSLGALYEMRINRRGLTVRRSSAA